MAKTMSLFLLKLLLVLIFSAWVSLWVLKQTEFWTRKWKQAEQNANASIFGYNGLDFVVYTLPLIVFAIIGFIYLEMKQGEPRNRKRRRGAITSFTNPLFVNQTIGILSGIQIIASSMFVLFLIWTFYSRLSNDFKKMTPNKSFKLSLWQYKVFRMATRSGLLSEACLALLLLPVLRGMSVFQLFGVQFEASVRYHIWFGTAMIFFSTLHGAGTFFIWGIKDRLQDEMWKWQKQGRIYLAGEISLAAGLVIWITSLPQIRRKWFELFYYTHHLYIVFLVFFLFHCGDRHFYMVFPGVFLFVLDKLFRILQSKPETCILSARVFPCRAIELSLPKDPRLKYTPTSVIFVKIPSISKFQWHPFSLTSSSSINEHTMSVIIKNEGEWTNSLYDKIHHSEQDTESNQRQCIPIAIEGPYGPASLDFLRYDNLFLVTGGIGITPFLSILQEIGSKLTNSEFRYPNRIQLIYAVKKSEQISLLNPILPQLLDIEKFHINLKVFVTQENKNGTSLREVLKDIPEIETKNFSTIGYTHATIGPKRLVLMASITMVSSLVFLLVLVFFNHYVTPQPAKKSSEKKNPPWRIDLLFMCSFATAIIVAALMVVLMEWKRLNEGVEIFSEKQRKRLKESSVDLDTYEIHFGARPDFQGLLSNMKSECGGSEIGVLVCGPESMKETVASACRLNAQEKKPHLSFHSLNFTL